MAITSHHDQQRRRLVIFLAGTFLVTWTAWWTLAALTGAGAMSVDSLAGFALFVLGGSAPTWMAYLAVARTPGAGSLQAFNARVFRLRVPLVAFVVALAGVPVLGLLARLVTSWFTSVDWPADTLATLGRYLTVLIVSIVLGGIEEVGWRGVLQPAVTARRRAAATPVGTPASPPSSATQPAGPADADADDVAGGDGPERLAVSGLAVQHLGVVNLGIAVVWAVWHLPLFWVVGDPRQGASFAIYTVAAFGYSAIMTALYARTESVALCVLFHAGINAASTVGWAFATAEQPGFAVQAAVLVVAGVAVLWLTQRRLQGPGG